MNESSNVKELFLDEDIEVKLKNILQELKSQYESIKETVVIEACNWQSVRRCDASCSINQDFINAFFNKVLSKIINFHNSLFGNDFIKSFKIPGKETQSPILEIQNHYHSSFNASDLHSAVDWNHLQDVSSDQIYVNAEQCHTTSLKSSPVNHFSDKSGGRLITSENSYLGLSFTNTKAETIHRSDRLQTQQNTFSGSGNSPVLHRKVKFKKKKRRRIFFPHIPAKLLKNLTNPDFLIDFLLPPSIKHCVDRKCNNKVYQQCFEQNNMPSSHTCDNLQFHKEETTSKSSSLCESETGPVTSSMNTPDIIESNTPQSFLGGCECKLKDHISLKDNRLLEVCMEQVLFDKKNSEKLIIKLYKSDMYLALICDAHTTEVYQEQNNIWTKVWFSQSEISTTVCCQRRQRNLLKELLKRKIIVEGKSSLHNSSSDHDQHSSSSKDKEVANEGLFSFLPSTTSRKKRKIASQENILKDELPVDSLMWMMNDQILSHSHYILKMNLEFSVCWLSTYGGGGCSKDNGIENVSQINLEHLQCVTTLPSLQFVMSSTKLVKYRWDKEKSQFVQQLTIMPVEDSVVSLCSLNQQPHALIGCSTNMLYIWNHISGCLLQQIPLSDKEMMYRELLDASSHKGLLLLHVMMDLDDYSIFGGVACNPFSGKSRIMIKNRKASSTKRMILYDENNNVHVLHNRTDIQLKLKERYFMKFSKAERTNLATCQRK